MIKIQKKGIVEPIRDWDGLISMLDYCLETEQYRNWLMLKLGINFALRISDLLKLKVSDVYDSDMFPRNKFNLREKKTGKENLITINNGANESLQNYAKITRIKYSENYLFKSRKGVNNAIDRVQAYRVLRKIAKEAGIDDVKIGTHTLRKTWGYHGFKRFNFSLDEIMLKLNHQSIASTKRYIGLTADEKAAIENKFVF